MFLYIIFFIAILVIALLLRFKRCDACGRPTSDTYYYVGDILCPDCFLYYINGSIPTW